MFKEPHSSGRRITIRDVASASGVSIATVSRVLNGGTDFLSETQRKVWSAAHALGYRPNHSARMLRGGAVPDHVRTNLIMRIIEMGSSSPFGRLSMAENVQLFDWLANKRGLFTTVYRYHEAEGFRCPPLLDGLIDGVIVGSPHEEVISAIAGKVPTVAVEVGDSCHYPDVPCVNPDVEPGIREMLVRAYGLGHRRLGIVGVPLVGNALSPQYLRSIDRALSDMSFEVRPEHRYLPENLSNANHDVLMSGIVERMVPEIRAGRLSLVVCQDMVYAESIYQGLSRSGILVPEDVSLISVNSNCGIGQGLDHPITSVAHDWHRLFDSAIDVLQVLISGRTLSSNAFLVSSLLDWGTTLGAFKHVP